MAESFRMDNIPFSLLNEQEQALVSASLDLGYYQKGEKIITAGETPEGVFVILKGRVRESDAGDEDPHVFVHYENEDYFGGWSSLRGKAIHDFIAEEETICHILPTQTLLELIQSNARFADYFQQSFSARSEIAAQHGKGQDMTEFMLAKISNASVREPLIVEQGTSIQQATRLMREHKADSVLARKGGRYGMVTGTDLLNAVVLQGMSLQTDVSAIASYRLVTADIDDYLFNALVLMTQQQIERVVVMPGQRAGGYRGADRCTQLLLQPLPCDRPAHRARLHHRRPAPGHPRAQRPDQGVDLHRSKDPFHHGSVGGDERPHHGEAV